MKNSIKRPVVAAVTLALAGALPASALAVDTVNLGAADSFAVLGSTAVTNVPNSTIDGDIGLSPAAGSNYSGITQAQVNGTIYAVDGTGPAGAVVDPTLLTQAKNDLSAAYVDAAGRTPTQTFLTLDNQLGGQILTTGVYAFGAATTANLTGTLTLVGGVNDVFIFQASSTLITASNSTVVLQGGVQSCNIFWVVGSSTTLGSSSSFVGTVMSQTATGLNSSATLDGRAMANTAAVTLNQNTITNSVCAAVVPPVTPTTPDTTTGTQADAASEFDIAATAGELPDAGLGAGAYAGTVSLLYGLWQLKRFRSDRKLARK